MRSWSDQVADRINCFGLQDWLPALAQWLGLEANEFLPREARDRYVLRVPRHGFALVFRHPHAGYSDIADVSRWILESVHFVASSSLPFGMDGSAETVASAKLALGEASAVGTSPRVSFFYRIFGWWTWHSEKQGEELMK